MRRYLKVFSGILLLLTVAAEAQDQAIITIDKILDDDVIRIEVHIEFSMGKIKIARGNPSKAITGFIEYNEEMIRPKIEYEVRGRTGIFMLETETRRQAWSFARLHDLDDNYLPESELYFTTRVPIDIDFSCGLGSAELELGDLKISGLRLENGLGETIIDFSTPNSVELRRLDVKNGLGELVARNLSNANTSQLRFDSGLGKATLEFGGEIRRDMQVTATIGLGSMKFKIPRDYNIELDADDNFLSTIDTPGLVQVRRGFYRSHDYDSSNPTIFIKASVGLGTIQLVRID